MKAGVDKALIAASDAVEYLRDHLEDMTLQDQVDLAARLNAVTKNCEAIDKIIKGDIKKRLKNKAGVFLGDMFKAVLQLIPTQKFQQALLKEADPATYEAYCKTEDVQRVTFEPR